ncbi:hypothetical protein ACF1BE_02010 [Streptomyces sp. NPDC014991]|uniref:hypothetical protein n=1 Tax=Streptomyces sp. NPDC014991 TaxID=3364935 RepID=UPI0036FB75C2
MHGAVADADAERVPATCTPTPRGTSIRCRAEQAVRIEPSSLRASTRPGAPGVSAHAQNGKVTVRTAN